MTRRSRGELTPQDQGERLMEATKETTYGAGTIIGVEGRAAWARCRCGTVRQLALHGLAGRQQPKLRVFEPAGHEEASAVILVRRRHLQRRGDRREKAPVRRRDQMTDVDEPSEARTWTPLRACRHCADPLRAHRRRRLSDLDAHGSCRRCCGRFRFRAGCWSRPPAAAICRSNSAAPDSKSRRLIFTVTRILRSRHRDGRYPRADDARGIRVGRHQSAL